MPEISRREMLIGTGVGGGLISLFLAVPIVGFALSPLFAKNALETAVIGPIDEVPINTPTPFIASLKEGTGWNTGPVPRVVYVVKYQATPPQGNQPGSPVQLLTFANVCTHMQCDVHWDGSFAGPANPGEAATNGRFLCPCHGGLYDINGLNVYGPPPSPLPQWVSTTFKNAGKTYVRIRNQFNESI